MSRMPSRFCTGQRCQRICSLALDPPTAVSNPIRVEASRDEAVSRKCDQQYPLDDLQYALHTGCTIRAHCIINVVLADIGSLIAYFVAAFAIVKNLSSESSAATRAGSRGLLNMVRHFSILEVTMNQRRTSNSPLLDPSFCTVVLISPDALDQGPADPSTPATCKRATEVIAKAAEIAGVPVFVLSARHLEQQFSSSPALSSMRGHVRFVFEQHTSPWSHQAFVEALSAQDRTILILAGLWLEHEILATALNALVDGYDVYVLLDGSAPRSRLASMTARERLTQAGGTPITASQVISEWSFETTDTSLRAELIALLRVFLDIK